MDRLYFSSKKSMPLEVHLEKEKEGTYLIQIRSGIKTNSVRRLRAKYFKKTGDSVIILTYDDHSLKLEDVEKLQSFKNIDFINRGTTSQLTKELALGFPLGTKINLSNYI